MTRNRRGAHEIIVGPPAVSRIHTYMYKRFVETAVLICLMVLSIE
jgi:hypothetical protein